MQPQRVILVDDHSLFRRGVRNALESRPGVEVVGEARDGLEAIDLATRTMPDLILMDIGMPRCNGLEATRRIKRALPHVKIVILTVSDGDADLFDAVKSGAQGYVLKDVEPDELCSMVERVAQGEAPLSGLLATKILNEFRQREASPVEAAVDPLSEREVQVLKLVASGKSNREIAEELVITEHTVKHHLRNILDKLHLQNRLQIAVYAAQHDRRESMGAN